MATKDHGMRQILELLIEVQQHQAYQSEQRSMPSVNQTQDDAQARVQNLLLDAFLPSDSQHVAPTLQRHQRQ